MHNLWGHFTTINKHKYIVTTLCFRCGLYKQGLLHDISKYSLLEFKTGVKYFQGNVSPNGMDKKLHGYSAAWLHHKGRNKHHWEYWLDITYGTCMPVKMPVKYVVEMFCDRVAATKTYWKSDYQSDSPLQYYTRNYGNIIIDNDTRKLLELMLEHMAQHGLDETISFIKSKVLPNGYNILNL